MNEKELIKEYNELKNELSVIYKKIFELRKRLRSHFVPLAVRAIKNKDNLTAFETMNRCPDESVQDIIAYEINHS